MHKNQLKSYKIIKKSRIFKKGVDKSGIYGILKAVKTY